MPPLTSGTSFFDPRIDDEGTYSYVVSDGCDVDTAYLDVSIFANGLDIVSDTTVCQGDSLVVNADIGIPGSTYQWSTGETTAEITVYNSGVYFVDVQSGNCTLQDEIVVTFSSLPLDIGNDTVVCEGRRLRLDADIGVAGATYLWSTGAVTPAITAGAGTYQVVVTSGDCTATDEITISEITNVVDLGNDTTICSGGMLLLDADIGIAGAAYNWSNGAVTSSIMVSASGEYSVEVSLSGCSNSDTIQVSISDVSVDLGDDFTLCAGDDALLNADTGIPGTAYNWSNGEATPAILISSGGTYWVTASVNGCVDQDTIVVTAVTSGIIPVDLGNDTTICQGQSILLSSGYTTAAYDHTWSSGSQNATINTSSAGVYIVNLANACQTGTDTIEIFTMDCDTTDPGDTTVVEPFCEILMPSGFTPNNDGQNDLFGPVNMCPDAADLLFRIYNRYGELIFEGNQFNPWDGSFKGEPVLLDAYIWYLEWKDPDRGEIRDEGNVIVIR